MLYSIQMRMSVFEQMGERERVINRVCPLVSHIPGVDSRDHVSPFRRGETHTLHRRVVDHEFE
jgi:hypothetical protein